MDALELMCKKYLGLSHGSRAGIKTGMNIRVDNPKEADRIVNAIAAYSLRSLGNY